MYLQINTYMLTEYIELPDNGELSILVDDNERVIANNDILRLSDDYRGNIHRLTSDGIDLSSAKIKTGDIISYVEDAITSKDYLTPGRFVIQKIVPGEDDWTVLTTDIKNGDLIRFVAYGSNIILPVGNPGNPGSSNLTIVPSVYPSAPSGWTVGDDWPESFPTQKPLHVENGEIVAWSAGDALPIGLIQMYGVITIEKNITPLILDNAIWYNIDGTLWTSMLSTNSFLELDEVINSEAGVRKLVPDYSAILNETFISFVTDDNKYLLQMTSTRRNDEDFLLYLPKINEIKFSKKITNLHALSENDMGVFTQDEIWYIQTILNDYGSVGALTKPVKSKLPIGCRDGSDIITALDGKAIIFTTFRGVTVLSPEDFVATTEQTITYLSDNISKKYNSFYNDAVYNAMFMPNEFTTTYSPMIKIVSYKYWILFYRYMDREILVFDTRSSSWWSWSTPYPIKSMTVNTNLYVLMQLDFSPLENNTIFVPPNTPSKLGVSFVLAENYLTYFDDTIANAIDGKTSMIADVHKVYYPSPTIQWSFTSQRLYFNEINNYKLIKAINLNARGEGTQTAKISTKVFRDFYHPEKSEVVEIKN